MRRQSLLLLYVMGSLLLGPTGYANDFSASSSELPSTFLVVQAQSDSDQPASGVVQIEPAPTIETPDAAPIELGDVASPQETGEVQERAVIRDHRAQPGTFTPSQPAPPPIAQPGPKQLPPNLAPAPSGMAPLPGVTVPPPSGKSPPSLHGPLYRGPTEDLTKVANAIQVRTKSLTTVVKIPPGLTLTGSTPVQIGVKYDSPGYLGTVQTTRPGSMYPSTYSPASGTVIYIWDREGNGAPRPVNFTITLSQGPHNWDYFGAPVVATLTPLYEAIVSGLTFYMDSHCDLFGKGEIHLGWWSPDGAWREPPSFRLAPGGSRGVGEFRWEAKEQSYAAIQQFRMPAVGFWENDPAKSLKSPFIKPSPAPLLIPPAPQKSNELVRLHLRDSGGDSSCTATAVFNMWRNVMQFKDLP